MAKDSPPVTGSAARRAAAVFLFFAAVALFGDTPIQPASGAWSAGDRLRFPLWVLLESWPGGEDPVTDSLLQYPLSELRSLAPFIIEGMIYGWQFSYTPYDRTRGVEEHFSCEPLAGLPNRNSGISFTEPRIQEGRLFCWVEFTVTPQVERQRSRWYSVVYPKVSGTGRGSVTDEAAGIKTAYSQAILNAVREYVRRIEKNKPKEINGAVLLTEIPRLYIESGKYVAKLEFILNVTEVIPYRIF
ncbi:MAG: hypothetical protein LBR47_04960 [Spirochaetaceae bacterium]|jgi:hypothetical protein|nr:hypothetical protein [Spirochaetaceae bacterium]